MDPAMLKLGHYKDDQRKFWQYVDRGIDDILCNCNRVLFLFADDKFQPFKSFFPFLDFYFYFFIFIPWFQIIMVSLFHWKLSSAFLLCS